MPSAVRGVRGVRRRDADASESESSSDDEDMSRASADIAAQSAADAMLFSAPADLGPDGGFDVKEAARVLARQSAMKSARDPRALFRRGRGGAGDGGGEAYARLSESASETESDESASRRGARSPPAESYEARVARAVREREALTKQWG